MRFGISMMWLGWFERGMAEIVDAVCVWASMCCVFLVCGPSSLVVFLDMYYYLFTWVFLVVFMS